MKITENARAWMEQTRNHHSVLKDTILLELGLVQYKPLWFL